MPAAATSLAEQPPHPAAGGNADQDDFETTQLLGAARGGAAALAHQQQQPATTGRHFSLEFPASSSHIADSSRGAAACLCGAHALARWGWRTWEFAVAIILIKLFPGSLLLVSLYGLLDNLTRLLLGAWIGGMIDRSDRLKGAEASYSLQNACIGVSAGAAALLVWLDERTPAGLRARHPVLYWSLTATCMVVGASSSVGSLGAAVAVEREHTKVLCGTDSAALRQLNSVMRAIDLLSQMIAPVAAGFLMSYGSMLAAIAVLALYSLCAWVPECLLLQAAHRRSAALRQPKAQVHTAGAAGHKAKQHPLQLLLGAAGWLTYFRQRTLLPGVSLALLYLTVLSLGFLMTSWLVFQGMSEATISLFRAAGALSGLAATAVFHPLQRCGVSLTAAGGLGISWQLLWLLAGVAPVLLGTVTTAGRLYVLLTGLVASRFGLWLFDLAVSQLQQELVPDSELGTVSGVQASLQSAFEILSFIAGSVLHQPSQFHVLMAGSCGAVATAAGLYWAHACRGRLGS